MSLEAYQSAVAAQFAGKRPPNTLSDITWTQDYLSAGAGAGSPILLALAENWEGPSASLRDQLSAAPNWLDGYQFSMWGEPFFLEIVEHWLRGDHRIEEAWNGGEPLACAATWSGTRDVMADIGRFLGRGRTGRVIYSNPAYDYAAVLAGGGFSDGAVAASPDAGFAPDVKDLIRAMSWGDAAVFVLNAQQNPTARQWSVESIREILQAAIANKLAVIFDDAHYALVTPGTERISALATWLDLVAASVETPDWFAVRSLGKQLNCNGWGVGVVSGPHRLLAQLVLNVRPAHQYNINARAQNAVAHHLASGGADADTMHMNARIQRNRTALFARINAARLPLASPEEQVCTPFCWFPLPAHLDRQALMRRTGVLTGDLLPSPMASANEAVRFARVYAGVHPDVFDAALERLLPALSG